MRRLSFIVLLLVSALTCFAQNPIPAKLAVAPHYPAIAVTARVAGEVSVRVEINSQGTVLRAESTDGPLPLREASEEAAKQWKFQPIAGGERTTTLRFVYVLLSETTDAAYDVKFQLPNEIIVEKHPSKTSMSDGVSAPASPPKLNIDRMLTSFSYDCAPRFVELPVLNTF